MRARLFRVMAGMRHRCGREPRRRTDESGQRERTHKAWLAQHLERCTPGGGEIAGQKRDEQAAKHEVFYQAMC